VKCPTCGKRIPDGSIECPHCAPPSLLALDPRPITPKSAFGSLPLAFAGGMVLAILGAFGWAAYFSWTGHLSAWPALVIGAMVGLAIRVLGGESSTAKGFVGSLCGVVGIGGGIAMIVVALEVDMEALSKGADFINFAMIFVGLSLARSLAQGKKVTLKDVGVDFPFGQPVRKQPPAKRQPTPRK